MTAKITHVGLALILSLTLGVTACTPGNNVPGSTIAGAAAGGLIGAAAFSGSGAWLGVLGGALVGGIVGNQIGQYMDRQDAARAQAVYASQSGRGQWTNSQTGYTYTIRPVKTYHRQGRYCREYQTTASIAGRKQQIFGTACREPDGTWKVVS